MPGKRRNETRFHQRVGDGSPEFGGECSNRALGHDCIRVVNLVASYAALKFVTGNTVTDFLSPAS
jgi:hypothetical protein